MLTRLLLVLSAVLLAAAPAASAHPSDATPPDDGSSGVVPLSGKGENIAGVKRVKLAGATEVELAGDWAFVATDRTDKTPGGLTIVNVADPENPFVEGTWHSPQDGIEDGSYGDVDLSPDGNLAVVTNAHCDDCEEGEVVWAALIDVSDKAKPRLVGKIVDDETMDYVHTATLDDDTLYLNPQVAAFYPQPGNAHITAFDVSDPANPVKKGVIAPPGADAGLAHDTYIDHRPDGKTLMYAASISKSDVIDITDPMEPTWLQSSTSTYTISHDVQPNHDRSLILVDDEGALGGQLDESVSACGKVGEGPASADSGSLHFYEAAEDGTFANGGAVHLGSFNAPTNVNTGACVAHVFWQAPDENRLTQAYYRTGAFVLDYEDPSSPQMLGWFVADGGAKYWSNKPHNGYMYATDMEHGLDILRYTGEGGKRWPATAGPAEVQRSARQGVPYVPIERTDRRPATPAGPPASNDSQGQGASPQPAPASGAQPAASGPAPGSFRLKVKLRRVPGRKGSRVPLVVRFTDTSGKVVRRLTVRRRAGRRAAVRVRGVALDGAYRWRVTAGRRVLKSGRLLVRASSGVSLAPGAVLKARAR